MMRTLSFVLAWFCCLPAFAADAPAAPPAQAPVENWLDVTPTPYGPMLIQQGAAALPRLPDEPRADAGGKEALA